MKYFYKLLTSVLILYVIALIGCAKSALTPYDERNRIISEEEIAKEKTNNNAIIYTIGGGVLSFGTSLFISSLIYRKADDFKVVNPISVGGGVVGTAFLFWQGKKRDRMLAIERIKDRRKLAAESELESKKAKKTQLQKQLEDLKKEKARVDAEKKRIKEQLKKKKEKK